MVARRQTEPCGHLASIPEVMSGTQARKQGTGRRRSDAAQLHESPTARILARDFADCAIVFDQPVLDVVGMLKQIADSPPGLARQSIQMRHDFPSQTVGALWQYHAEFGEQPTRPVVDRGPFRDETLPCPMQAERRLLVFVPQQDETYARTCHRLADRRRIRRVILAALARHPVRRHKLWRDNWHRLPLPVGVDEGRDFIMVL